MFLLIWILDDLIKIFLTAKKYHKHLNVCDFYFVSGFLCLEKKTNYGNNLSHFKMKKKVALKINSFLQMFTYIEILSNKNMNACEAHKMQMLFNEEKKTNQ